MITVTSRPCPTGPRLPALRGAVCVGLLAWGVLILLEASPAAELLDHGSWTDPGIARLLCLNESGDTSIGTLLGSLAGWNVMVLAMMWVPAVFQTPEHRPDAAALAGFLLIWTGYGIIAHLVGAGLGALVAGSNAFAFSAWPIGAALFALAGMMEFRGCAPLPGPAHWLGLGWTSLRSCWALMGLMFAYFSDSLLWMMVLSALMFVNCASPHRAALKQILAVVLISIAVLITALNLP